jgi:hypothetical protein
MRRSTDQTLMVCEKYVKQGVATRMLPQSTVKFETNDTGEVV